MKKNKDGINIYIIIECNKIINVSFEKSLVDYAF